MDAISFRNQGEKLSADYWEDGVLLSHVVVWTSVLNCLKTQHLDHAIDPGGKSVSE